MNKRYLNTVLGILLVIIWGSVIYKFFGKSKEIAMTNHTEISNMKYSCNYAITKDTFNLILINKTPFKASKPKLILQKKVQITPKKAPLKTNIKYPTITYHGFVKGENKTTRLILLKVDNKLFRKREKETINDVTIVKAYSDSLIVSFNNNLKTIKK